ncbi:hypothetical protein [Rhodococcus sp. 27YEA15]|uniref:hypothetical protein n=1 Tax=Rhodococcus sp. 27YEA15 TaxID=3156259 RepID=UPI003C7EB6AE
MMIRKMTVAAVAVAAALAMTACSSDDNKTDTTTTASTTTSAAAAATTTTVDEPAAALPTAAELNEKLTQALDEGVPAGDKTSLVQGSEADPELINQVVAAAKANNAQVEIVDPVVDTGSDTASASLNIIVNGQALPSSQASFVYEDGTWKLAKVTACTIVAMAGLTTPACAA